MYVKYIDAAHDRSYQHTLTRIMEPWRTEIVSGEHGLHHLDSIEERVDIRIISIDTERRTHRTAYAETLHKWLGAMVTCADSYAHLVENHACVVRVYAVDEERDSPRVTTSTTYYADTADRLEPFDGAVGESLILRLDIVHTNGLNKTDGGCKGYGGSIVWSPRLEL